MNAETNRIEYKQELTDDLEKESVAFLNYLEGGVLYIGIEKTGTAIGVTDIDRDILKIKDRLVGHWVVFRVGGWSPHLPTRFHVSGRTLELAQLSPFSST